MKAIGALCGLLLVSSANAQQLNDAKPYDLTPDQTKTVKAVIKAKVGALGRLDFGEMRALKLDNGVIICGVAYERTPGLLAKRIPFSGTIEVGGPFLPLDLGVYPETANDADRSCARLGLDTF